jgi:hypothetical protein
MHQLRAAMLDAATPERVAEVVMKLGDQAAAGDVASAKIYLDHVCGKPVQALSLANPDGSPLGGDLAVLQRAILTALAPHPEARYAVGRALMALRSDGDGRNNDAGDGA